jgi:membrane dipeptidase
VIAPTRFFDGHLDLAYLTEIGRDMHAGLEDCRGRYFPAAVTLPSLREGGVRACLGTIFTEALIDPSDPSSETGAFAYPVGNALAARACGLRQLKLYQAWRDAGVIELLRPPAVGRTAGLDRTQPEPSRLGVLPLSAPLAVGLLMECADPIETPDQLDEFPGLLVVGMAWARGSRYAAGNGQDVRNNPGLTAMGRVLVDRLDEQGVLHDLSHLSDRALDDLLSHTNARVIASHSNCRSLCKSGDSTRDQRHLTDETIKQIAARDGIIGLNLYAPFIDPACIQTSGPADQKSRSKRPTIAQAIDHVEHICTLIGHTRCVGLGSDMDGGFTADRLPIGIQSPNDLPKLLEELASRNWSDDELHAFAWGNWARVLGIKDEPDILP